MAFKKVEAGNTIDIKKGGTGSELLGYFLGSKKIQVTFKGKIKEQTIWNFAGEKGGKFSVWGFGGLNFYMHNVPVGVMCRITYKGQSKEKNDFGQFPHQATVEIDTEKRMPKREQTEPDAPEEKRPLDEDGNEIPF